MVLITTVAGVTLFTPYFIPKHSTPHAGPVLRVATFNVSCGNQQLTKVEEWLNEVRADVVFLQELPQDYGQGGIAAVADVYRYQLREPGELRTCGNMLLSRHPIRSFEYLRMDEAIAAYWLQHATAVINGYELSLYNVHLIKPLRNSAEATSSSNLLSMLTRYDPRTRDRQIERLMTVLQREPLPFIAAGDFNMTDQSSIYRRVAGQIHDAFRAAGRGFGATWPAATGPAWRAWLPPLLRIDYIWSSSEITPQAAAVGPELGSDHLPLEATFVASETSQTAAAREVPKR
jgi:vancomycin resistance protein VanJ